MYGGAWLTTGRNAVLLRYMETVSINKALYDALKKANVDEATATSAAASVVTRKDEHIATKSDVSELRGMLKVLVALNVGIALAVVGLYLG